VSTCQAVANSHAGFVFSDGHGLAAYTDWFDDLGDLNEVDWDLVCKRYWANTDVDSDRRRRKQAEFLVYHFVDWELIRGIGVIDAARKGQVETILSQFPARMHRPVVVRRAWYY
jgi:hypothetical protein